MVNAFQIIVSIHLILNHSTFLDHAEGSNNNSPAKLSLKTVYDDDHPETTSSISKDRQKLEAQHVPYLAENSLAVSSSSKSDELTTITVDDYDYPKTTSPSKNRQKLEAQYVHHFANEMKKKYDGKICVTQWHAVQVLNAYSGNGIALMCRAAHAAVHPVTSSTSTDAPEIQNWSHRLIIGRLYFESSAEANDMNLWTDVVKCKRETHSKKILFVVKGRSEDCVYFVRPKATFRGDLFKDVEDEFILDENFESDVKLSFKFTNYARVIGSKVEPHVIQLMKDLQMMNIQ